MDIITVVIINIEILILWFYTKEKQMRSEVHE